MEHVPVETILYGSFVKMDRMQQLTVNTFSNTSIASATNLNIFIDLYSVLKSIFSESYRTDISDYTSITSGIVNMCSHYRTFFKRLSVRTKFYLIYSFNTCDINRKFVAGYNQKFYEKSQIPTFHKLALDNFDLLELIWPYLPDIFFIRSARNYESSIIMAYLIEMLNDKQPNLIISKDLYPLQLTYQYPYTSFLYPIKRQGGIDASVMIPISEKSTFREEFWTLVCNLRKTVLTHVLDLSPVNFTLLSAMSRFPERNVTTLATISKARWLIEHMVGTNEIRILPQQLYEDQEVATRIPVALVESRLKALDLRFILPYYKNDPESKSIRLQNLQDSAALNNINAKFFTKNPLELSRL